MLNKTAKNLFFYFGFSIFVVKIQFKTGQMLEPLMALLLTAMRKFIQRHMWFRLLLENLRFTLWQKEIQYLKRAL